MPTKIKSKCEKCGRDLVHESGSYACSNSCTFCGKCAKEMNYICPNCMGKLVKSEKAKEKS